MRVAVVGAFVPGYDVGLEESYVRALLATGHDVVRVPLWPRGPSAVPGWGRVREIDDVMRRQSLARHQVLDARADLILLVKGRGVLGSTVRAWRAQGLRVVNVFPDDPIEGSGAGLVGRTLLGQFRELDRLFVHDRFAVGRLRQLGIRAEYIAFARDPAIHDPDAQPDSASGPDPIVFVGNPDPERIRYLRAVADLGLGLYGSWAWARLKPGDPLMACVRGGVQLGADMVRTMRSARLSINILRVSQKTAHNMRTFEIPACRVCCLSEWSNGVVELLRAGRDIETFRSPEELRRTAIRLLASSSTIDEVARAGRTRVEHETYVHRVEQVLG